MTDDADEVHAGPEGRDMGEPDSPDIDTDAQANDADGSDLGPDDPDIDLDDSEGEPDGAPFSAVVLPTVKVLWPAGVLPPVAAIDRAELPRLLANLDALAAVLQQLADSDDLGCLTPAGVRWCAHDGWQLLLTPPYGVDGEVWTAPLRFNEQSRAAAWQRDLHAVAISLVEAAFGRRPESPQEARRLADVSAGELPHGFDAVVNLLLRDKVRPGDAEPLRALATALGRRSDGPLTARCYLETGVGSAKAKGRSTLDNEDAAGGEVTDDGDVRLAVFDGTTGDGDGSGRIAAQAALDSVLADWRRGTGSPRTALSRAEAAVTRATTGCTTAVVAAVDAKGSARLASVGDSAAWLVRPTGRRGFHAWRLTPVHTTYADGLRAGAEQRGGFSDLTRYLGGAAGSPFASEFTVCADDLLVLATDGATAEERNEWFGDLLCGLSATYAGEDSRARGAALAADLVGRAERAGGFDNATVLIADFTITTV